MQSTVLRRLKKELNQLTANPSPPNKNKFWGWARAGVVTPPWGPWNPMGASWWHHGATMKPP